MEGKQSCQSLRSKPPSLLFCFSSHEVFFFFSSPSLCSFSHFFSPRDAAVISHVEEKLSASRKLLQQLKAQEQSIQRAQKKADTHKKMTEF